MTVVAGLDLGGTKLAGAAYEPGTWRELAAAQRPRPPHAAGADGIVAAVADLVAALERDAGAVTAVGLAVAALLDGHHVVFSAHLPLRGEDLGGALRAALGLPVALANDADAAALAEAHLGAARGEPDVLCVLLGTGVGGAHVVGGVPQRGARGMAGEYGHVRVVPDGRACPCGQRGCWERYCSGTALQRAAAERGSDLTGPALTAAARAGDPAARGAFDEVADWLGAGLAGLVAALDPGLVVLGGGLVEAADLLLPRASRSLAGHLSGGTWRTPPRLVASALGPDAGVLGAALLGAALLAAG